MAVAMAAWSLGLHFIAADNSLRALENTICSAPLLKLKSSSGFAATEPCCILHKRSDTGRKVEEPELLEAIRLTIINNLIQYHPESSFRLALGAALGILPPEKQVDVDIATHINISDDGPDRSSLYVETADRPGLLVDLVKIITDINIAVESGEFDTEGLLAKAKLHVSYKGKSIIKPLQQVLANSLRYFLRRPTTEESSF